MARFLDLLRDGQFATGVTAYDDHYPGDEANARIVVVISLEGQLTTQAIVDTGAPWCVLNPQIADEILSQDALLYEPETKLKIRGISYAGRLCRMRIGLRSKQAGEDLEVDATVFVPKLRAGESWRHPNFLGLSGFLERMCFAVDPAESAFYFGPA
jgi:hypothetical protein